MEDAKKWIYVLQSHAILEKYVIMVCVLKKVATVLLGMNVKTQFVYLLILVVIKFVLKDINVKMENVGIYVIILHAV